MTFLLDWRMWLAVASGFGAMIAWQKEKVFAMFLLTVALGLADKVGQTPGRGSDTGGTKA